MKRLLEVGEVLALTLTPDLEVRDAGVAAECSLCVWHQLAQAGQCHTSKPR